MSVATEVPMTLADAHVRGFDLVERHSTRFIDFVNGLSVDDVDRPVPGTAWTVGETVTHVHAVFGRYTSDLRRATSPAGVGEQNQQDIERLGVDLRASAAAIAQHLEVMRTFPTLLEPSTLVPFHAGQQTTLAGGWGNLLGELLAHGDDIARATGTAFGIPSADMEVLWRFAAPLLQGWLQMTTAHDTWLLRFPFGAIVVTFDGPTLTWTPGPTSDADQEISVPDAAEFALVFPYRRRPAPEANSAELVRRFAPL